MPPMPVARTKRSSRLTPLVLVGTLLALVLGAAPAYTLSFGSTRLAASAVEGVLSVRHGDDFERGRATARSYYLLTSRGSTRLTFAGPPPNESLAGAQVRMRGVRYGSTFEVSADGTQTLAPTSTVAGVASGAKRVAVVLLNFANDTSQPWTPAYAAGIAFTNENSVAAYYEETSWGQLTLTGDVYGWYTVPEPNTSCSTGTWASSATKAAAAAGVSLSGYDHVVYAFPKTSSCGWAGLAEMPGRNSWLNGSLAMSLQTMAHELGHNFGTHHASDYKCTENGVRVSLSANASNCSSGEYGDPYSVMGMASRFHHSNFARGNFGWLQTANTQTVTSGGEYLLKPIESFDAGGVQVLRIQRTSSTYLTLEFRQPYGLNFDVFPATAAVTNGVSIRITPGYTTRSQSKLVDATPATTSFSDSALPIGATLVDPLTGISITTVGVSPSGATVRISFGGGAPLPTDVTAPTQPGSIPRRASRFHSGLALLERELGQRRRRRLPRLPQLGARRDRDGTFVRGRRLVPATSYAYQVVAFDAAANVGPAVNAVATTPAGAGSPAADAVAPCQHHRT